MLQNLLMKMGHGDLIDLICMELDEETQKKITEAVLNKLQAKATKEVEVINQLKEANEKAR